jgi:putative SOS response-associated peptidase YedK
MCNVYSMTAAREAVLRLFRVGHNRAAQIEPLPAIFPGHTAPVVRLAADGERELVPMSWGFVLLQEGRAPKRVTNTRDDKIDGRFWRPSFEVRRCLVPATAFCEPNDGRAAGEKATWHWFALAGDEPRPLFALAGIWQRWRGPVKKDGPSLELDVFSFMTTQPNALTMTINHERSPVLLTGESERDAWLHGTPAEARTLLSPLAAERMRIVQEGFEKRDLIA